MLPQKDYDQFHTVVNSSSFTADQFEIGTTDYIDRSERLYPDFTRVYILHKETNVTTRYVAGCGAYWLQMFERDLDKGVFKFI